MLSRNVLREDYPSRPNGMQCFPSTSNRNLILSCPFRASELYLSIPAQKRSATQSAIPITSAFSTSTPARTRSPPPSAHFEESPVPTQPLTQPPIPITPARHPHAPLLHAQYGDIRAMEIDLECQEEDILVNARACFQAREFRRAVHVLQGCRSSKARFLSIYSNFIVSGTGVYLGLT
jgi:anaphase-promoting complex subunit 8